MPMGNKVTGLKEHYDNYNKLDSSYYKPEPISLHCRKVITRNALPVSLSMQRTKYCALSSFSMINAVFAPIWPHQALLGQWLSEVLRYSRRVTGTWKMSEINPKLLNFQGNFSQEKIHKMCSYYSDVLKLTNGKKAECICLFLV